MFFHKTSYVRPRSSASSLSCCMQREFEKQLFQSISIDPSNSECPYPASWWTASLVCHTSIVFEQLRTVSKKTVFQPSLVSPSEDSAVSHKNAQPSFMCNVPTQIGLNLRLKHQQLEAATARPTRTAQAVRPPMGTRRRMLLDAASVVKDGPLFGWTARASSPSSRACRPNSAHFPRCHPSKPYKCSVHACKVVALNHHVVAFTLPNEHLHATTDSSQQAAAQTMNHQLQSQTPRYLVVDSRCLVPMSVWNGVRDRPISGGGPGFGGGKKKGGSSVS